VLQLALHEIFIGREGNLVSINQPHLDFPDSQPFLVGTISPTYGLQIMQIRCPGCMARKFPPTFVFISFFGNEDKISKSALEDNLF
jgi:hypothetical protein